MKIAVTSASGKLGAAIVKALKKLTDSDNIIGIARTPEKAQHLGIEIRKGDYNNRKEYVQALEGINTVLLISGNDQPQKRIPQHLNVIEATKEAGARKIVYTSIFGRVGDSSFDEIMLSNRTTEKHIIDSGLNWAIGRNGLYLEPDMEALDQYIKEGKIKNCAAEGKCGYTTRDELAFAYSQMILEDNRNGNIYTLSGESITQQQLVDLINEVYGTSIVYESMSIEEYFQDRTAAYGKVFGSIIAGIYAKIRNGNFNLPSDFEKAAGRKHIDIKEFIQQYKMNHSES